MKRIQTDSSSFRGIIECESLYVDKTQIIHRLVSSCNTYYLFTRPRRFGKSLTLSTLASIFKGEKELFKDTWLYDKYEFEEYPVVHISMSLLKGSSIESYQRCLKKMLFKIARDYGVSDQIEYLKNDYNRTYAIFARLLEAIYSVFYAFRKSIKPRSANKLTA